MAFVLLVLLPAPLLGSYMYRVFEGRAAGSRWSSAPPWPAVASDGREQDWKSYALSLLAFNGAGFWSAVPDPDGPGPALTRNNCQALSWCNPPSTPPSAS